MISRKINFKQPKYIFPAILYVIVMFTGFFVIRSVKAGTHVDSHDPRLKATDYLSSDLPDANTDSVLGSKMDNTEKEYGDIDDESGMNNIDNDRDSVNKKQEYDSQYNRHETDILQQQDQLRQEQTEARQIRSMQNRVRHNRSGHSYSNNSDNFVSPVSNSDIARIERVRRQRDLDTMNRDLATSPLYNSGRKAYYEDSAFPNEASSYTDTSTPPLTYDKQGQPVYQNRNGITNYLKEVATQPHQQSSNEDQPEKVVKKVKTGSDYFNTISSSSESSKMIKAIIDENVKAVDGSRVRLRLLDDIEIGGTTVKKGAYLYALMSGFGKQRVNGTIQSIFYNDDIIRIHLTIYDTDGLPGLYVPESSFRESSKEILSSATQGGSTLMNNSSNSENSGLKEWAAQAAQNASNRVMSTISKNIRKNRVKLKYGTLVYLIDSSQQSKKSK